MRTDTAYRSAVSQLALDCQSGRHPGFEIENQSSAIGARFGVADADVREDVSQAQDRLTANADELAAMRARRSEITAERDQLHAQPESDARDIRIDGIESELDGIDARLGELGIALDAVA